MPQASRSPSSAMNAGMIWEDSPVVVDGNLITSRTPADLPYFSKALIAALRK